MKCGVIEKNPEMCYDSLNINNKKGYRYWRYVSPRNGHCNIAEIVFSSKGNEISPENTFNDGFTEDGYDISFAFDKDELTFYESKKADGNWIAADFGHPVKIDKIIYLPRNDDNNVVPGHLYSLEYYDKTTCVNIEIKEACGYEISFNNVPTNALYILHDLTKGKEERIFTIEDGIINWH